MATDTETYTDQVSHLEANLASCAKRSLEAFSQAFVDGSDQFKYYTDQWKDPARKSRLQKRTPLQIERDRVLYSDGMRKLTEKYHVLYNGRSRIVRNFSTHSMRAQQVARAICRGLDLNSDFAEAIALGAKSGALPFVHASKEAVSNWIHNKLRDLDSQARKQHVPLPKYDHKQLQLQFNSPLPPWIQDLSSEEIIESAKKYIPWAAGQDVNTIYSSGQQAYWQLCTNPYSVESTGKGFSPETMFGVWRHTLGLPLGNGSFHHSCQLPGASPRNEIKWEHVTYEAIVVQYADDITWVIENLNDAHHAALLNRANSIYAAAATHLQIPETDPLFPAISSGNAGSIYTYFINDFISNSTSKLQAVGKDGLHNRTALRTGVGRGIGLSSEAEAHLSSLKTFLMNEVFQEPRVKNRYMMLYTISEACMSLLYSGSEEPITRIIEDKALLGRWSNSTKATALSLVTNPVHRIQLAVDIFAGMGDQEIYDFVGVQAL